MYELCDLLDSNKMMPQITISELHSEVMGIELIWNCEMMEIQLMGMADRVIDLLLKMDGHETEVVQHILMIEYIEKIILLQV